MIRDFTISEFYMKLLQNSFRIGKDTPETLHTLKIVLWHRSLILYSKFIITF
jgi:hypothetical protein